MPFSNDLINQIRRIEIRTCHKVEDLFAGSYLSVFKGRGIHVDAALAPTNPATMCGRWI